MAGATACSLNSENRGISTGWKPTTRSFHSSPNRPEGRFDCIVSFEVLEHATDPAHVLAEINDLLEEPGLILFSTLLQPLDIDRLGLNWWYAGPRNGHVSLYSRLSLESLTRPLGLTLRSFSEGLHVAFRGIPAFANRFLQVYRPYSPAPGPNAGA